MNDNKNTNKNLAQNYTSTFFIVPHYISSLPGMTLGFLRFYEAIFQFWNKDRHCFLGNEALQEKSGLKHTQINEAFKYFENLGELERVYKGGKRYIIQKTRAIETDIELRSAPPEPCASIELRSAPPDLGYRSTGSGGTGRADHIYKEKEVEIKKLNNINKNTREPKNSNPQPKFEGAYHQGVIESPPLKTNDGEIMAYVEGPFAAHQQREAEEKKSLAIATQLNSAALAVRGTYNLTPMQEADFDTFWSLYPKKHAIEKVRAAWYQSGCHLNSREIILKLRCLLENCESWTDVKFVPSPARFIAEQRWNDIPVIREKPKSHFDNTDTSWADKSNFGILDNF